MQGNRTETPTENVVSFLGRAKKPIEDESLVASPSLDDVIRKNRENKDRMEKERLKANQSVIKSYRLKPKT